MVPTSTASCLFALYNSTEPWFFQNQTAPHHAPLVSQFWMTATPNDDQATNYLFPKVKLNGYTATLDTGSKWTILICIVLQLKGC